MKTPPTTLRLGTRASLLARAQSQLIADQLTHDWPNLRVELRLIQTTGDRITDRPLADVGGKGLFTKELEQALLDDQIDFAVHSYKDLPVTMPLVDQSDLVVAAVPPREDPQDVFVMRDRIPTFPGAKIGTSSLRRRCQLLEKYPDAQIQPLRGNIDTRLRKLREGQYDAIVLAAAGLKRSRLFDPAVMPSADLLPAAGQGAIALQCRRSDISTQKLLQTLNDPDTAAAVDAERALVLHLRGDCHSPIAVLATLTHTNEDIALYFQAAVGARDGNPPIIRADSLTQFKGETDRDAFKPLVAEVLKSLIAQGAMKLLHGSPQNSP